MSELVQEALKSEDVEKLKNVRKVEKNAFTRFENRLKKLLVTESDKVTFKLEEINYEEVVDAFARYEAVYNNLQSLSDQICVVDQQSLDKEDSDSYICAVENSYFDTRRLVSKYKSQVENAVTMAENAQSENASNMVLEDYVSALDSAEVAVKIIAGKNAEEIFSLGDALLLQPVQLLKSTLQTTFMAASAENARLEANPSGNLKAQLDKKFKFDHKVEFAKKKDVIAKLDTIINAQYILMNKKEATSRSGSISSEVSSLPSPSHAVKLAKPDPISFSGNSRDWSSFSRDFEQLIVPGRDDTAIGVYFKQAIPMKHRHLLDSCALNEWK